MDRRQFLSLMAGVASWRALRLQPALAQDKSLSYADMHSHIGVLGGHADVRETMMRNGVLVISRNIVSDAPVIRRIPGKGIQQVRQPAAGELASRFDLALERMRAEHKEQSLIEITDSVSLERVMSAPEPGVVLTAEGGDFLDGDLKRLEGARRNGLVHLQLLHYRVSELGDISTELPVHNGLTVFGREVVSACNRLGILIDVAHATSEGIVQALDVSSKPMIYSHGHVTSSGPHWTESLLWTLARATNVQEGLSARSRSRHSARHCKREVTTQWALAARSRRVEPKGPVCVVAPRCIVGAMPPRRASHPDPFGSTSLTLKSITGSRLHEYVHRLACRGATHADDAAVLAHQSRASGHAAFLSHGRLL
ncbi:MAG: membrane dipeptidase [Pseudomonadota bacterium]